MKKVMILALMATGLTMTANAEQLETTETQQEKATIEIPAWVKNIKFSGYGILQYQGTDKKNTKSNTFNLRLARFILDGKIGDFDWRAQIQGTNVKGPGEPTVQLVDLYAEWVKYKEARIRVGQFKRCFTFENPTHPVTQGWRGYADVINNLSGFGDRTGEKSSGGRDIGIQLQGDLFPASDGHRYLHYQVGVYNGEGINRKDKDNRKDLIGGLWVMPIKGLRIGAFGWLGSKGDMVVGNVAGKDVVENVPQNRYALSAEYSTGEYMFRAEYVHSQGWGVAADQAGKGGNVINYDMGDKADGWYAFGIVPIIKGKLHAKARYQVYRPTKTYVGKLDSNTGKRVGGAITQYEAGVNYFFTKNIELHLEYSHVNDRTWEKHNYNLIDAELAFRF
jgi:phosphate-selective porin